MIVQKEESLSVRIIEEKQFFVVGAIVNMVEIVGKQRRKILV